MANWIKNSSTSERLQEAMRSARMKQADLARATGLSKGGISNYVTGRYEPKSDIISKLAKALGVSEMWLWGYDVPKDRTITKSNSPTEAELTEGEQMWLELYHRVSDDTRDMLIKMMNSFDCLPDDRKEFALQVIRAALGGHE